MPTQKEISEAVTVLRNHLIGEIKQHERAIETCRSKLLKLDTMPGVPSSKDASLSLNRKKRTWILRQALESLKGQSFTPRMLRDRAYHLYPEALDLLSIVAVSKVLNKLLTQPHPEVIRISKGAGRKDAIFTLVEKEEPKAQPPRDLSLPNARANLAIFEALDTPNWEKNPPKPV